MTMKTLRAQQRAERLAYVERLIAQAGSVRQAAKRAGVDRGNFQALRRNLRQLTASAPARTN